MPAWVWLIAAYIIGGLFPFTRITGMLKGKAA